jgi:uncharacterized protein YqgC (DUF456 family)
MDILVVVITFLVMLAGVAGVVVPVLPDVWLIWLAAVAYGLLQEPFFNGWVGGVALGVLTLLALAGQAADWLGGHAGAAAKGGVAWQSLAASVILGLVGLLFFPPIGPLVGALLGLFAAEFLRHQRNWRKALETVKGYIAGVGLSVVARLGICLAMIGVWALWVAVTKLVIPWLAVTLK